PSRAIRRSLLAATNFSSPGSFRGQADYGPDAFFLSRGSVEYLVVQLLLRGKNSVYDRSTLKEWPVGLFQKRRRGKKEKISWPERREGRRDTNARWQMSSGQLCVYNTEYARPTPDGEDASFSRIRTWWAVVDRRR